MYKRVFESIRQSGVVKKEMVPNCCTTYCCCWYVVGCDCFVVVDSALGACFTFGNILITTSPDDANCTHTLMLEKPKTQKCGGAYGRGEKCIRETIFIHFFILARSAYIIFVQAYVERLVLKLRWVVFFNCCHY